MSETGQGSHTLQVRPLSNHTEGHGAHDKRSLSMDRRSGLGLGLGQSALCNALHGLVKVKATPLKEWPSPTTAEPCPFYHSIESAELNNKGYGDDAVE